MYGGLTLPAFFTQNLNIPKVCKQKLGFLKKQDQFETLYALSVN